MARAKETTTQRRARRVRHKLSQINRAGLPRLSVHRSNNQIYAQVIDDTKGTTLAAASTLDKDLKASIKSGATVVSAGEVGKLVAQRAKAAGVTKVMFDRGSFLYHGRIKALADGAREGGLEF
jgi:large subunit ribosomal protein L18